MTTEQTPTYRESDIAVIGVAGRFPGAKDIETFWENLCNGVESITFFSDQETDQHEPGLLDDPNYVKAGAVLDDIEQFDAPFFGYSSREAALTDPQQRILLECAWEAFEQAGYNPEIYPGAVGVYAGSSLSTYLLNNVGPSLGAPLQQPFIETNMAQFQAKIGNDRSYLATRISYKLNLTGPSVNVQTACSTSLVAVHMACQSLLSGECDMALAGGVSIVVPHKGGYLYEEGMVRSSDGHCRAFDAKAEGTIFGNGAGLVLLKRLPDALADNDPIVAVVKGSAINNDGSLKVGYTAPSVDGQAAVIAEALAMADVDAGTIGYVETHGTATKLGDPIEVAGLTKAFLQSTNADSLDADQCAIGSVKTNIGHLDEAAGIAGFIKATLAVQRGQIPPSLYFSRPNPQIEFDETPFFVNTTLRPWSSNGTPRRAGVSSFGVGGTNSHIVLEEPPMREVAHASPHSDIHHLFMLSAHNEEALHELTQRNIEYIDNQPNLDLGDFCFTTNTERKQFDQRLAVVADSPAKLSTQLQKSIQMPTSKPTLNEKRTIAFLFSGHGGQYPGMGQQLYATEPLFREMIDQCDDIIRTEQYLDCSLLEILYPDPEANSQNLIEIFAYAQPTIFAIEYALSQLWISWGIEPDIVMGHSTGEYVAACVAGIFSLRDGLKLVCKRGQLMQAADPNGEMVAVNASEAQVAELLQTIDWPEENGGPKSVTIATLNGPKNLVISGVTTALDLVCERFAVAGIKHERLAIPVAAHSPLMASVLPEYTPITQQIDYAEPRYTFISNVTGGVVTEEVATAEYWCRHLVQPVRFAEGMQIIEDLGANIFIEMGATPTLLGMGRRCLPEHNGLWLPSLRAKRDDWQQVLTSLAELYMHGIDVEWRYIDSYIDSYIDNERPRCRLPLPTYPFQRKRHWIDAPNGTLAASTPQIHSTTRRDSLHPLLGERLDTPGTQELRFQSQIHKNSPIWLKDHRVFDVIALPGIAFFEMVLAAASTISTTHDPCLEDVVIQRSLILPEDDQPISVQVVLVPQETETMGVYTFQIFSLLPSIEDTQPRTWIEHANGKLRLEDRTAPEVTDLSSKRTKYHETISANGIYQYKDAYELGPSFRATETVWKTETSGLTHLILPEHLQNEAAAYRLHPAMTDAGLLTLLIFSPEEKFSSMPVAVKRLHFYGNPGHRSLWCESRMTAEPDASSQFVKGDLHFFDVDGQLIADMEELVIMQTDRAAMLKAQGAALWKNWLYKVGWQPAKALPPIQTDIQKEQQTSWLIFLGDHASSMQQQFARLSDTRGIHCTIVMTGETYEQIEPQIFRINPERKTDFAQLLVDCGPVHNVVYLGEFANMDTSPDRIAYATSVAVLHLVQALTHLETSPQLWLITHGAQAVNEETVQSVAQSSLWGLGKVIAAEYPELHCRRVDLDPTKESEIQTQMLFDEIKTRASESTEDIDDEMAYRNQTRYISRLTRHHYRVPPTQQKKIAADVSYLITGGMGDLGFQMAEHLVHQGARHLILVGRRAPKKTVQETIKRWQENGIAVTVAQADVSQLDQVQELLARIEETGYPLRGIIHAAGLIDDGVLQQQTAERFWQVMAPKVQGTWHLHQLTLEQPLDFFVLFSSATSLLGTAGQANYAAANAFLDGFASYRRGLGLPCLSINWGSWSEVGMTARLGLVEMLQQKGEGVLSPQIGVEIAEELLTESAAQIAVMPINWRRFLSHADNDRLFYENFVNLRENTSGKTSAKTTSQNGNFRQKLENAPSRERLTMLETHIREQVAETIGLDVIELPTEEHMGFVDLGMDSLTSIELRNRLQRSLDYSLPVTFAFDYATVEKAVAYLQEIILAPMNGESNHIANTTPGNSPRNSQGDVLAASSQTDPGVVEQSEDAHEADVSKQKGEENTLAAMYEKLSKQLGT